VTNPQEITLSAAPAVARHLVGENSGHSVRYFHVLKRKKGLLLAGTIAGMILGFCATLPALRVYQARTSVEIAGINENFLNIKQSDPVSYADSRNDGTDLETQIAILKSNSLRERVRAKLGGSSQRTEPETLLEKLGLDRRKQADDPGVALSMAAASVRVTPTPWSRVIDVAVDSTNPSIAADFANTLINEFIEQNIEARWQSSLRTEQWLTRQIEDMRVKLERSEGKLQEYARQAGLLSANEKSSVTEDRLRQVQEQLSKAQAELVTKQARNEMLISNPDAVPDILNDEGIQGIQQKLADLRSQVADLTVTYTTQSSQVRRLMAQIQNMEEARDKALKRIAEEIRNEYEEALRKERLIDTQFQTLKAQVSNEGEQTIEYNLLKGEAESNRRMYEAMLQQLKQSSIASAMRASTVRVVDPAEKPAQPYKPNQARAVILGAITGWFLCAGMVVWRQYTDGAIRDPGEVTAWTGIPELGLIPNCRIGRRTVYQPIKASIKNAPGTGRRRSPELTAWQAGSSRFAESFRATLMSMLFAKQNGSRPRTLVVTSAGPMEGKSTVAANLGVVLVQMGLRVLLIDADLRKPRLHTIFGIESEMGLIGVLKKMGESEEKIENEMFIRSTELPGLSILPAGGATSESTSLLYGDRLQKLFQRLRDQYDMVLVDTPPMLDIPDARVIGRVADTTILVVRAGATTRSAVSAAVQRLSEDGIQLLGAIVNDWNPANSSVGYYGYSAKYYTIPIDQPTQKNKAS
jgi:capsular exopolysaccharide synthesis family protein